MHSPSEPEPEAPRALSKSDRTQLVRFLKATGLWPLRLPELTASTPRRRTPARAKPRQPWEPKPPRA